MFPAIGFVVIMGMVFGGFMLSGGHFEVILKALPFEMMMIGGAAAGAMIISNDPATLKGLGGGMTKVMVGPKWGKKDYSDLLSLLFQLTKLMKTKGVAALEAHIDRPHESAIFTKYPKIEKDHFATDFICDTLRMMTMNLDDPHQVEDAMEKQLEKHHHESMKPAGAMQNTADALPALGIVAAVLGIVITMGAISGPVEQIGEHVGAALTGTFLGVLLAYGFLNPLSAAIENGNAEETRFFAFLKSSVVAFAKGFAPIVAVEFARRAIYSNHRPTFQEMETACKQAAKAK
jgi:chemotaxis protein MotA